MQPKVFIASSDESKSLAVTLQEILEPHASIRVWHQDVFQINRGNLENLLNIIHDFDFACILVTPDDHLTSRDEEYFAPRDNLLFEFGLLLEALGRDRVFFLHEREPRLKLPSDLAGVALLDYKVPDDDNPAESVLAPPAERIRKAILQHGRRSTSTFSRRYAPILGRGDRVSTITDAALYYARPRFGYKEAIRGHIQNHEVIPASYFYVTEEGAQSWMTMTSNPAYRFHNNSLSLIKVFAPKLTRDLISSVGPSLDIDFISLGSGDGEKDRLLIGDMVSAKNRSIIYYPIDISDKLLVESIRNVFGGALDYSGVRTKAVIGDFTTLSLLRSVYEDRPSPNVFSVLGNTFGNTDEAKILNALRESMYSGDFLLLEINCDLDDVRSNSSFMTTEAAMDYACLPIRVLGLEVDLANAHVEEEQHLSVFACARSAATYYENLILDGVEVPVVRLFYDHRYDFERFKVELAEYLGLEIIRAERRGSAGLVLAKKP